MNSLAKRDELATEIGETTEISWRGSELMSFEEWEAVGRTLQQIGASLNWWLGDWLAHGERKWGEKYAQALEITGLSVETLSKYKQVSERIAPEIRQQSLKWTHHFAVAYTEPGLRGPVLEIVAHFQISTRETKDMMRLSPNQLRELLAAYDNEELEDRADLFRRINEIRLAYSEKPMINGQAQLGTTMRQLASETPAASDDDDDAPFQGKLLPEQEDEEPSVFIEEVMEFFDMEGAKLQRCTRDEAAWDGLIVLAALDHRGRPYLKWSKPRRG